MVGKLLFWVYHPPPPWVIATWSMKNKLLYMRILINEHTDINRGKEDPMETSMPVASCFVCNR